MNRKFILPVSVGLCAVLGAVLRGRNLISGYEPTTHLPIHGNLSESILIFLTIASAALLILFAYRMRPHRGIAFEDAFSGESTLFKMISVICGIFLCACGACGLYLAAVQNPGMPFSSKLPLFPLWLLAILSGICLMSLASALSRHTITESTASLTIIPMFWACFDLILTFKDNGSSPFVGLYAFELLAAIALTYAFYSLAGFLYATPNPSRFVFSAGMAVILCITCVGGALISIGNGQAAISFSTPTLLRYGCFLASSIWLFALLTQIAHLSSDAPRSQI